MSTFLKSFKAGSLKRSSQYGPTPSSNSYTEYYMQWVPATVIDVIANSDSPAYSDISDINSILVRKNLENYNISKGGNRTKYKPLLSGLQQLPVQGEPVLVFETGNCNYYIGPLTGNTNQPNFNVDPLSSRVNYRPDQVETKDPNKNFRDRYNIPHNYILAPIPRLQKVLKPKLDNPGDYKVGELGSIAKHHTHGDTVIEGRYGNSIRVGSRSSYPLVFISNGRSMNIPFESFYDQSIFGMTSAGSLSQHYGTFQLASDGIEDNVRKVMGTTNLHSTGNEMFGKFNYEFGMREDVNSGPSLAGQIYMGSDRLVFNARRSSITLSALKSIDLGAGTSFTVNTKRDTIIESSNIYLGKEAKVKKDDDDNKQPLVLGNNLKKFIDELLDILVQQHGLVNGVPVPLVNASGAPIATLLQQMKAKLEQPEFWSDYHYIENNGQKAD